MPHVNRVFNLVVSNVSFNGSVNMANAIIKGGAADENSVGGQALFGDQIDSVLASGFNPEVQADPDLIDQQQTQA